MQVCVLDKKKKMVYANCGILNGFIQIYRISVHVISSKWKIL